MPNEILASQNIFKNKDHSYSLILFHLDLVDKKVIITRAGNDLKNLDIRPEFSYNQYGFNTGLPGSPTTTNKPTAETKLNPST